MVNLEKLTLCFRARQQNSFIDGTYLTNEISSHMLYLHEFTFDIVTEETRINAHPLPRTNDIRRTFIENGYHADCYVEYCKYRIGRCHIYSLPFTMDRIQSITSRFSSGIFVNVRILRIFDIAYSFEHSFFVRISRSFPLLHQLSISNEIERLEKPLSTTKKSKDISSVIEFKHLTNLLLESVHIDYVEQFLSCLNTQVPKLNALWINYEQLVTVTKNFTKDDIRLNCAKIQQLFFWDGIPRAHTRNFYLYFPSL